VLLGGAAHGVRLINPGTDPVARAAFADFLAKYAPVSS
jgi:hypothetical protein